MAIQRRTFWPFSTPMLFIIRFEAFARKIYSNAVLDIHTRITVSDHTRIIGQHKLCLDKCWDFVRICGQRKTEEKLKSITYTYHYISVINRVIFLYLFWSWTKILTPFKSDDGNLPPCILKQFFASTYTAVIASCIPFPVAPFPC